MSYGHADEINEQTGNTSGPATGTLVPLTSALQARPGSDAKELARMARQRAATRA